MKLSIKNLTDQQISDNLNHWYYQATAQQIALGTVWYAEAQAFSLYLSETYAVSKYQAAAVISALSPNNKWARNMLDAETIIAVFMGGGDCNAVKVCTYNANKLKAISILSDGIAIAANAPKTHAFAMNIGLLSNDHITVDKHHLRACVTTSASTVHCIETCTAKQYRRIEAITAELQPALLRLQEKDAELSANGAVLREKAEALKKDTGL